MLFYGLFALALLSRRGLGLLCVALLGLVLTHGLYPVDGMMLAKLYLANVRLQPIATAAMIGLGVAVFVFGHDFGLRFLGRAGIVLAPQPQIVGRGWRPVVDWLRKRMPSI